MTPDTGQHKKPRILLGSSFLRHFQVAGDFLDNHHTVLFGKSVLCERQEPCQTNGGKLCKCQIVLFHQNPKLFVQDAENPSFGHYSSARYFLTNAGRVIRPSDRICSSSSLSSISISCLNRPLTSSSQSLMSLSIVNLGASLRGCGVQADPSTVGNGRRNTSRSPPESLEHISI